MAAKRKTTKRNTKSRSRSRRNRKLQSERLPFSGQVAGIVALVSALSLVYLWHCSRNESLGLKLKDGERDIASLKAQVALEEDRWLDMTGIGNMRKSLEKHGLDMDWPDPSRVVHVRDLNVWIANGGQHRLYGQLDRREGSRL